MSNNKKKIRLNLHTSCFNKEEKDHLCFKYKGIMYCLTHSQCGNSKVIPPEELHMKDKSLKKQFIKPALNQKAPFVNRTNMFVNKKFIESIVQKLNV